MSKVAVSDVTFNFMHKGAQGKVFAWEDTASSQKPALLYLSVLSQEDRERKKRRQGQPGNERRASRDRGHG